MSQNHSDVFTLVVLGTDGKYTPDEGYLSTHSLLSTDPEKQKLVRDAKLQNTLSFIAKSIDGQDYNPEGLIQISDVNKKFPASIHNLNANVTVIDGPDTAGLGVGNITAYGVLTILNAILQGKAQINLVGFSRGAVIINQIANYIQRMKDKWKIYQEEANVHLDVDEFYNNVLSLGKSNSIINNFSGQGWIINRLEYSTASIKKVLGNLDKFNKIKSFLSSTEPAFKMFCLDPVQGPRWNLKSHYVVPEIVKNAEFLYHEDERTYGFNPLFSSALDEANTLCSYFNIPGFHGIGDGNLFDHNFSKVDLTPEQLSHRFLIQEIVFLKIIKMLKITGVQFYSPGEAQNSRLDASLRTFLASWEQDQIDDLLTEKYDALLENLPCDVMAAWRESLYISKELIPGDEAEAPRQVKNSYDKKNHLHLDDVLIFKIKGNRKFISKEHLQLKFKKIFKELLITDERVSPINRLVGEFDNFICRINSGFFNDFFHSHYLIPEQSQTAYSIIEAKINEMLTIYFYHSISAQEAYAVEQIYSKLLNLPFDKTSDVIIRERKNILNCFIKYQVKNYSSDDVLKLFLHDVKEFNKSNDNILVDSLSVQKSILVRLLERNVLPKNYLRINRELLKFDLLLNEKIFRYVVIPSLRLTSKYLKQQELENIPSSTGKRVRDVEPSNQSLPPLKRIGVQESPKLHMPNLIGQNRQVPLLLLKNESENILSGTEKRDGDVEPSNQSLPSSKRIGVQESPKLHIPKKSPSLFNEHHKDALVMFMTSTIALTLAIALAVTVGDKALVACILLGVIAAACNGTGVYQLQPKGNQLAFNRV